MTIPFRQSLLLVTTIFVPFSTLRASEKPSDAHVTHTESQQVRVWHLHLTPGLDRKFRAQMVIPNTPGESTAFCAYGKTNSARLQPQWKEFLHCPAHQLHWEIMAQPIFQLNQHTGQAETYRFGPKPLIYPNAVRSSSPSFFDVAFNPWDCMQWTLRMRKNIKENSWTIDMTQWLADEQEIVSHLQLSKRTEPFECPPQCRIEGASARFWLAPGQAVHVNHITDKWTYLDTLPEPTWAQKWKYRLGLIPYPYHRSRVLVIVEMLVQNPTPLSKN